MLTIMEYFTLPIYNDLNEIHLRPGSNVAFDHKSKRSDSNDSDVGALREFHVTRARDQIAFYSFHSFLASYVSSMRHSNLVIRIAGC